MPQVEVKMSNILYVFEFLVIYGRFPQNMRENEFMKLKPEKRR
jgi:hypothetical protein